jgi:hypothetical protein
MMKSSTHHTPHHQRAAPWRAITKGNDDDRRSKEDPDELGNDPIELTIFPVDVKSAKQALHDTESA